MTPDELRNQLVTIITDIIVAHQLPDYSHICRKCKQHLYGADSTTLSRHRAEKIVDDLDLVELHLAVEKEHGPE